MQLNETNGETSSEANEDDGNNKSRCTPERQAQLQAHKSAACGTPRSCKMGKAGLISDRDDILMRIANNQQCLAARLQIMNECFDGGDKAHQAEAQNVRNTLNICRGAL